MLFSSSHGETQMSWFQYCVVHKICTLVAMVRQEKLRYVLTMLRPGSIKYPFCAQVVESVRQSIFLTSRVLLNMERLCSSSIFHFTIAETVPLYCGMQFLKFKCPYVQKEDWEKYEYCVIFVLSLEVRGRGLCSAEDQTRACCVQSTNSRCC